MIVEIHGIIFQKYQYFSLSATKLYSLRYLFIINVSLKKEINCFSLFIEDPISGYLELQSGIPNIFRTNSQLCFPCLGFFVPQL